MTPFTLLSVFSLVVILIVWRARRPARLPPTPPGLPLLGNALQLPSLGLFRKLEEWQRELGGIYSFSALGQRTVVLGDAQVAADVLDRMAAVTSGRPMFPLFELMTKQMTFATIPYGERWRRHRRIVHENLNVRTSTAYLIIQQDSAAELIHRLAAPHTSLGEVLHRFSGATIWRALYGDSSSRADEQIKSFSPMLKTLNHAVAPTASVVNMIPILARLPGPINPWKRYGEAFYSSYETFALDMVQGGSATETKSGFVINCLKWMEKSSDVGELDIASVAVNLFAAALETTAHTLHFFVLAMLLYPNVACKAQGIIDAVVGGRAPTFQDRDKLTYLDALVKELLRWRPVAPYGLPHEATKEFVYNGYVISKGTMLMANIWYICHNPEVFHDPDVFDPGRFLDSSSQIKKPTSDYHDDMLAFGYGRRICPGRDFAQNQLFISVAYLLWSFDFCKARDATGREITLSGDSIDDDGLFIFPSSFPYVLKPRRGQPMPRA